MSAGLSRPGNQGGAQIWTRTDAPALCALIDAALPGEQLSADEIVSACFEDPDPSVVLALPGGEGAVAAVARPPRDPPPSDGPPHVTTAERRDRPIVYLVLLAVEPAAQGEGRGRWLVRAAQEWAFDGIGAGRISAAGTSPFGLWPGVDVRWTRSLCLFEAAGYSGRGVALVLSCPSTHRAASPRGVEIRRVLEDVDAAAALAFCQAELPGWGREVARAVDHGCCFVAAAGQEVVGLICHSVNRFGWVGPVAVTADRRRRGIGRSLLGTVCRDLRDAGLPDVQISPSTPVEFFARSAGASVSRVFRQISLSRW